MNILDGFDVLDSETMKIPQWIDLIHEDWTIGLYPNRIGTFAIDSDGDLMLCDTCGNYKYCPKDRFKIRIKGSK